MIIFSAVHALIRACTAFLLGIGDYMARGGSPKGGHNNILTQCNATPADVSKLAGLALSVYMMEPPDLHSVEDVQRAIIGYFTTCKEHSVKPGNLGLYAALGMSRQDFNDVMRGKNKSKVNPACIDMMKRAARAVGVYREGLAMEGKIHPTTYIFMGKNYDGMEDYTRIEVSADNGPAASLSPEEIQQRIEKDIPIDGDYKEI